MTPDVNIRHFDMPTKSFASLLRLLTTPFLQLCLFSCNRHLSLLSYLGMYWYAPTPISMFSSFQCKGDLITFIDCIQTYVSVHDIIPVNMSRIYAFVPNLLIYNVFCKLKIPDSSMF